MKTKNILESSLKKLENMTKKEVQQLSKKRGIEIAEPKITDELFTIDLQGLFPEVINSK